MGSYNYYQIPDLDAADVEKIMRRVVRTGDDSCWDWVGAKSPLGYGIVRIKVGYKEYRNLFVHRVVFKIFTGVDPIGKQVCHHCDNPPCSNPVHLFLGTQRDNIHDMKSKGRMNTGARQRAAGVKLAALRLQRNIDTVPPVDVNLIREMWGSRMFSLRFIVRQFGVSRNMFLNVIRRDDWPGVPMLDPSLQVGNMLRKQYR